MLNVAFLLGYVATRPRPVGESGDRGFVLITRRDPEGRGVDRHPVVLESRSCVDLPDLAPGATAYVEGRLARYGAGTRLVVIAQQAWLVEPAAAGRKSTPGMGTHASPGAHPRRGHPRRLHRGSPDEAVIWVRSTWVGRPEARPSVGGEHTST